MDLRSEGESPANQVGGSPPGFTANLGKGTVMADMWVVDVTGEESPGPDFTLLFESNDAANGAADWLRGRVWGGTDVRVWGPARFATQADLDEVVEFLGDGEGA